MLEVWCSSLHLLRICTWKCNLCFLLPSTSALECFDFCWALGNCFQNRYRSLFYLFLLCDRRFAVWMWEIVLGLCKCTCLEFCEKPFERDGVCVQVSNFNALFSKRICKCTVLEFPAERVVQGNVICVWYAGRIRFWRRSLFVHVVVVWELELFGLCIWGELLYFVRAVHLLYLATLEFSSAVDSNKIKKCVLLLINWQ